MEIKPYGKILEDLLSSGETALKELIKNVQLENYYLDFKEVRNWENGKLDDSEKKNYSRALSGFSNSSGGLLIWGVEDETLELKPFAEPERFASLLNETAATITQPILTNVNSISIKSGSDPLKGYVVTEIPKYYLSPVQVIASIKECQHKYFMRSGSSFVPANHDLVSGLYNRVRSSKLSYAWSTDGEYQENDQIICYRFNLLLQNKGVGILRDLWVNFSASGIKIEIEKTGNTIVFDGWNIFGLGINLVTKDEYKCAPQGILNPFLLSIVIRKQDIPKNFSIYFSYGADGVAPEEVDIKKTGEELKSFLTGTNKSTEAFIAFLTNQPTKSI